MGFLSGTLRFALGLLLLHIGASYLFIHGFFLTKKELRNRSECDVIPFTDIGANNASHHPLHIKSHSLLSKYGYRKNDNDCWTPKRYDKVIMLLIDALRFDFASPIDAFTAIDTHSYATHTKVTYYQNQLTALQSLLESRPTHSKLFQFISDPPTTTAQRLKGLTTGGLPTFFDVSQSFSSSRIDVDSVLEQMKSQNYRSIFMGDDTWIELFDSASLFTQSYPYPSFDVYDLYTVDNGCKQHLFPALTNAADWDILISHFLGVDHVGHRYHMNHPIMAEKLGEMNEIISNVTEWIDTYHEQTDENVLLLIFGDHGMTPSGDHGGATSDEIEAALFAYSTRHLYPHPSFTIIDDNGQPSNVNRVAQVNLVPTLSLLLGIPIPFENIGSVIPELFVEISDSEGSTVNMGILEESWDDLLHALFLNSLQLYHYLQSYDIASADLTFGAEEQKNLDAMLLRALTELEHITQMRTSKSETASLKEIQHCALQFKQFLKKAYDLCKEKWTTFQLPSMQFGISMNIFGVFVFVCILFHHIMTGENRTSDMAIMWFSKPTFKVDLGIIGMCFVLTLHWCFNRESYLNWWPISQSLFIAICSAFLVSLLFQYRSVLMNDFDWWSVLDFDVAITMVSVVFYFQGLFTDTYIKYEPQLLLFLMILSLFFIGFSRFRSVNGRQKSVTLRVAWLAICAVLVRWIMGDLSQSVFEHDWEWLTVDTTVMLAYRYITVIGSPIAMVFMLWFIYRKADIVTIPSVIVQLCFTVVSYGALCLYWIEIGNDAFERSDVSSNDVSMSKSHLSTYVYTIWAVMFTQLVAFVYSTLNWNIPNLNGKYGMNRMAAIFLSLLTQIFHIIAPSIMLLLGAKSSPIVLCYLLFIYALSNTETSCSISTPYLWIGWLIFQCLFFATGHRCSFVSISWKAPFVGGLEYQFWRALIVLCIHHCAGHILAAFAIPMLIILKNQNCLSDIKSSSNNVVLSDISDVTRLNRVIDVMGCEMSRFVRSVALFSTLFVVCSMINCYIHRRHLMVWAVFAPKIIFDIVHIAIIDVLCIAMSLLVRYLLRSIRSGLKSKSQ